jgi:C4-dicarboxylate-specific signal transduction histidine kinase
MKKAALLSAILFCCLFSCAAQEQIEPEEYEVYKAWLENPLLLSDNKQIIIMKSTADFRFDFMEMPRHRRRKLFRLQNSTLKDYRLRNRQSSELTNEVRVNANVQLINSDLINFLSEPATLDFFEKTGAEFGIAFSRVGFNRKMNQALMDVNYRSVRTTKYATGYFFLFSWKKGKWVINQIGQSWIY